MKDEPGKNVIGVGWGVAKITGKAAKAIKNGKVIVFPTDTVYGLLGNAKSKSAVRKLFKIKKRLVGKPLPIFVKNINAAKKIAVINKAQGKFLKKNWPGKTTVILTRKGKEKIYGISKKTIGIRIPNYRLVNDLLERLNLPLTGTSANVSGRPASTKIKEILAQFKKQKIKPDLIIDAGNLKKSRPSKVIDLTGKKPKILRP